MSDYTELHNVLKKALGTESKYYIYPITSKKVDLIAVSQCFEEQDTEEREQLVRNAVQEAGLSVDISMMSLYTPEEADVLGVQVPSNEEEQTGRPVTWFDLMKWSLEKKRYKKEETIGPKVVSFYSFKGGVGRTTALVHTAWALASKGKKVVIVDLDFEAPSLHQAIGNFRVKPTKGLVDYLFERMNLRKEDTPSVSIQQIIGEAEVRNGRLFVVPAGKVDFDYISRVDELRKLPVHEFELWETFKKEIEKQLKPDIILIDSRTGINQWGALSLLTIADDSILFINPNPQNREGMTTILSALKNVGIEPTVVLSPVIDNENGRERAYKEWEKISENLTGAEKSKPVESLHDPKQGSSKSKPILIPYASGIALADEYPYEPATSNYQALVDLLDDETDRPKLIRALQGQNREEILQSLATAFSEYNQDDKVADYFQKQTGFERYVDASTIVVRGEKGVGKSTLHRMTLHHLDVLQQLAPGELEEVVPINGFEPDRFERVDFTKVRELLEQTQGTWRDFWAVHALLRFMEEESDLLTESSFLLKFRDQLKVQKWEEVLLDMVARGVAAWLYSANEALSLMKRLVANGRVYWMLYDGVDQWAGLNHTLKQEVLKGLLDFSHTFELMGIPNLLCKIFLQNQTWEQFEDQFIQNFVGKDTELTWGQADALRLVLRVARSSEPYANLVKKVVAVRELDKHDVPAHVVENALEPLWGTAFDDNRKVSDVVCEVISSSEVGLLPVAIIKVVSAAVDVQLQVIRANQDWISVDRLLYEAAIQNGLNFVATEILQEIRKKFPWLDKIGVIDFVIKKLAADRGTLLQWWNNLDDRGDATFEEFFQELLSTNMFIKFTDEYWVLRRIYIWT